MLRKIVESSLWAEFQPFQPFCSTIKPTSGTTFLSKDGARTKKDESVNENENERHYNNECAYGKV